MCQRDNNNALSGCIIITHSSSLTKFSAMVSLIGTLLMIGQWYLVWCCNITYCNPLFRPFVHKIFWSHVSLLLLVQMIWYLVCDFDISCTFSPAFRSVEYLLPVWRNGDLVKIFTSGGILSVTSHAFFFGIVLHHHQYILISCR
jgi:hypothetical protein